MLTKGTVNSVAVNGSYEINGSLQAPLQPVTSLNIVGFRTTTLGTVFSTEVQAVKLTLPLFRATIFTGLVSDYTERPSGQEICIPKRCSVMSVNGTREIIIQDDGRHNLVSCPEEDAADIPPRGKC